MTLTIVTNGPMAELQKTMLGMGALVLITTGLTQYYVGTTEAYTVAGLLVFVSVVALVIRVWARSESDTDR